MLASLQQREGVLNNEWLKAYQKAIDLGNWDKLFVPQYLFSWYLQEHTANLLQQAQNYLHCDLIRANVCNIYKHPETHQIDSIEGKSLIATKVILALGSPPNKGAFRETLEFFERLLGDKACYVANMYEPCQNSNIERIFDCLQANSDRAKYSNQVLIIGSSASALETIYSLNNLPQVANLIDKFIVFPSGAFPHRITDSPTSSTLCC